MIRKNISLYEKDVKKIAPLLEKNEGNLSAAVREMIEFVDFMLQKFGSLEEARRLEKRVKGVCIPRLMLNWFLTCTDACLPTEESIDSVEELIPLRALTDLEAFSAVGFNVTSSVEADDVRNPTRAAIRITGDRLQAEFVAKLAACCLAKQRSLSVEEVDRQATAITVRLKKQGEPGSEAAYTALRDSLLKHFGERHIMMQELLARPKFWNDVVTSSVEWGVLQRYRYPKLYQLSGYK
jgi:hypothetical protein